MIKKQTKAIQRRSKGRARSAVFYWTYNRNRRFQIKETNYEKYLLERARANAKEAGREITIVESDIVVPEYCPVLGIKLDRHATRKTRDWAPSVDRIDNTKGYISNNIVVVSLRANRIKNDSTIEELEKVLKFYQGLLSK